MGSPDPRQHSFPVPTMTVRVPNEHAGPSERSVSASRSRRHLMVCRGALGGHCPFEFPFVSVRTQPRTTVLNSVELQFFRRHMVQISPPPRLGVGFAAAQVPRVVIGIASSSVRGMSTLVRLGICAFLSSEFARYACLQAAGALLAFQFFFTPLLSLILNTHEWAHQDHDTLSWQVQWAQKLGFAPTSRQHTLHHMYFNRDFAVLNGWSNPLLNFALMFMGPRSEHWVTMWLLTAFFPAMGAVALAYFLRCRLARKSRQAARSTALSHTPALGKDID